MKTLFVSALLVLVGSACSQQTAEHQRRQPEPANTTVHSGPLRDASLYQLGSVWRDQSGREIPLESLRGTPRVISMIFTNCAYACPRITADMQAVSSRLSAAVRDEVRFVLFSMDPERDTPEALTAFAEKMDLPLSHWTLLCSTEDNVQEMAAVLGVKYKRDIYGNFSHSNMITVLDSEGEIIYKQEGLNQDPEGAVRALEALYPVQ